MINLMDGKSRMLLVLALFVSVVCVASVTDESMHAFEAAVRSVESAIANGDKEDQVVVSAAERLAVDLDRTDIELLKMKAVSTSKRDARRLAVVTLSKMKDPEASVALEDLVLEAKNIYVRREAMRSIGFMSTENARKAAHRVLAQSKDPETISACLRLLAAVGDRHSLAVIATMQDKEENALVTASVESAMKSLQHNLAESDDSARQAWMKQELAYWEHTIFMPDLVTLEGSFEQAGRQAIAGGNRFARPFLMAKLDLGEPLAVALVGFQAENWAVDHLEVYVAKRDVMGRLSRRALMRIGTPEACRILEKGIDSEDPNVIRESVKLLSRCGDAITLKALQNLSAQTDNDRIRSASNDAIEILVESKHKTTGSGKTP